VEVCYIDQPFKVESLPLKKIYVLDDWLSDEIHKKIWDITTFQTNWKKTNQVRGNNPTGLPHHELWGASIYLDADREWDESQPQQCLMWTKYLNDRLQTEFGFNWIDLQYVGLNSQTQEMHGTIHADCHDDNTQNLSFLYYPNEHWEKHWGGQLRFFEEVIAGLDNRKDGKQIAEVDFKPNRLVIFDGRVPHGADAPTKNARYSDRRSYVMRGDTVELCL
jgi:hypothetical protein